MNYKEITDLIKLIGKSNLSEFKVKDGEFELSIRTDKYSSARNVHFGGQTPNIPISTAPAYAPAPAAEPAKSDGAPAPATGSDTNTSEADTSGYVEIRSPMVGTFYRSSTPEKPPFVNVGDSVQVGATVCIVEAMKLFNEIESEISGKIVKVLLDDASPVEYDQPLFLVDPKG